MERATHFKLTTNEEQQTNKRASPPAFFHALTSGMFANRLLFAMVLSIPLRFHIQTQHTNFFEKNTQVTKTANNNNKTKEQRCLMVVVAWYGNAVSLLNSTPPSRAAKAIWNLFREVLVMRSRSCPLSRSFSGVSGCVPTSEQRSMLRSTSMLVYVAQMFVWEADKMAATFCLYFRC